MGNGKDWKVHQLNGRQFRQWQAGQRVTGRVAGGGCLMAVVALPFTALWALLHRR